MLLLSSSSSLLFDSKSTCFICRFLKRTVTSIEIANYSVCKCYEHKKSTPDIAPSTLSAHESLNRNTLLHIIATYHHKLWWTNSGAVSGFRIRLSQLATLHYYPPWNSMAALCELNGCNATKQQLLLGAFASEKWLMTSSFLYFRSNVSKWLTHGDFHENLYLGFLPKSVGVFRLRLRSDKKQTLYMKTYVPLWYIAMLGLHNWDCVPCELHHRLMNQFLDTFAKLRTRLLASSCLSVRMEQHDSHWTDFHEIWYLGILWKSVAKIQVTLKWDKNKGFYRWRPIHIFLSYPAHIFLKWEMFQAKVADNTSKHFVFSNFFLQNRAVYEIMWKNTAEWGRP